MAKVGHVTLTTPLLGTICHRQAGTCYDKPTTKFEVPIFTHYGNMKGVAKCRKWGGLGRFGVIQGHSKHKAGYLSNCIVVANNSK